MKLSNSAGLIAPNIDVKTGGDSYVVGPGSVVDGKPYTVECDAPIALLPDWLLARMREAPAKAPNADKIIVELDTPAAIEAAKVYLQSAEPAIEGKGGDKHTYDVAVRLLVIGLSQEVALDLLLTHWNERCEPSWNRMTFNRRLRMRGSTAKTRLDTITRTKC